MTPNYDMKAYINFFYYTYIPYVDQVADLNLYSICNEYLRKQLFDLYLADYKIYLFSKFQLDRTIIAEVMQKCSDALPGLLVGAYLHMCVRVSKR